MSAKTNRLQNRASSTRRRFLFNTPMAAASIIYRLHASAADPAKRPNIILAMSDDQGWGDVGYYGHPILKTPNLDRMAASGIRFNRFYAAAPVCSPTRASVMTGRYPNRYRCLDPCYDLPLREVTVAEAVKTAGYVTGHFGKWHLGGIPFADGGSNRGRVLEPPGPPEKKLRHPGNQGFDEWFSAGNWFDLDPDCLYHNGTAVGPLKGMPADIIIDRALNFIRQAVGRKQPFLAVIWFPEPHGPLKALEKDKAVYEAYPKDADYYGEISAVDRAMGLLRGELRRLRVHQNTMLWFNSDNGSPRQEHNGGLSGRKNFLMEGGIRVPAILEWPGRVPEPFVTEVPCCTMDFYPTMLDLLSVRMPNQIEPIDGISLLPLLDRKTTLRPKPIPFEIRNFIDGTISSAALIDNEYKLYRARPLAGWPSQIREVRPPSTPLGEQHDYLLNIVNDPKEEHDLAAAEPQILARLQAYLANWQRSVEKDLEAYPESRRSYADYQV